MTSTPDPDAERDPWLAEALRHAPDADAVPPAALSDTILRRAHAATTYASVASTPGTAQRLLAAWSWLTRPPVATGLASLMVATMVGLLWWDRPIDEALPRRPASVEPPPAATPPVAPARDLATTPSAAQERAAVPLPRPVTRPDQAATRSVAAPTPQPRPAVPVSAEPEPFSDDRKRLAAAPAATTAPAPEIVAAPRGTGAPAPAARDESPVPAVAVAPRALAKAGPMSSAGGNLAAARSDEATSPTAPLAALLASVTEQPQRWAWQRDAATRPMAPALQHWLLQLDAATAARWRPAAPAAGRSLRLYRDGSLQATLQIDADAVWFTPASPGARAARAALAPEALADLKRGLDEAAP